jgi:hypothetical protein
MLRRNVVRRTLVSVAQTRIALILVGIAERRPMSRYRNWTSRRAVTLTVMLICLGRYFARSLMR